MEMNSVWLSLRDAQSPVLYRNPDAELPARFVMSIGDALPAANASAALPARTIIITKDNVHHIANCQLHLTPSPAADYGNPASPYCEFALSRSLPQPMTQEELADFCFDLYWEVLGLRVNF
jgi:predicted component of type VI protein secretion system